MQNCSAHLSKVTKSDNLVQFPDLISKSEPTRSSPNRGHSATGRKREHLTKLEIAKLLTLAKSTSLYGHRNYTIVLMMYRHGLRVGEAANLQWTDIDFDIGQIYISRLKGSISGTHPLKGDELRALRKLSRDYPDTKYLFNSSRKAPLTARAISSMIKGLGNGSTEFGFPVHAHMLRHTCGFLLCEVGTHAVTIQNWLGHRNLQNTQRYMALSANAFSDMKDI